MRTHVTHNRWEVLVYFAEADTGLMPGMAERLGLRIAEAGIRCAVKVERTEKDQRIRVEVAHGLGQYRNSNTSADIARTLLAEVVS